ncbi:class I SAM-dependent methyltransferase [Achromobacter veterisilvae]|uniref:Class I SAM-dependent methyltransferase n=1 Tax=Achromobacter veterisilvae TaxID=2069367 RepID=A0ABZ2S799_9BURK
MPLNATAKSWRVGDLPFFYRCQPQPSNAAYGLPDRLSFELEFDAALGLVRQRPNADVDRALEICYRQGSEISGMMDDRGIGQQYAQDFLAYITRHEWDLAGKRVLEIGCGTGYLLSLLKARGADVLGIEPGAQGRDGSNRHGVQIINGFFPHPAVAGKFDLVIAYGVLEHIVDPVGFMRTIADSLSEGGAAYIAVPDCAPYLRTGDISCLLHEHWSYFNIGSLQRIVAAADLNGEVEASGFGGSLYCRVTSAQGRAAAATAEIAQAAAEFDRFRSMAQAAVGKMEQFLQGPGVAGIYVPGRMINLLATLASETQERMRFFDDNPAMTGLYFPGFPVNIENFEALKNSPPARLFIATKSFHSQVVLRIEQAAIDIPVVAWSEFFVQEATT